MMRLLLLAVFAIACARRAPIDVPLAFYPLPCNGGFIASPSLPRAINQQEQMQLLEWAVVIIPKQGGNVTMKSIVIKYGDKTGITSLIADYVHGEVRIRKEDIAHNHFHVTTWGGKIEDVVNLLASGVRLVPSKEMDGSLSGEPHQDVCPSFI